MTFDNLKKKCKRLKINKNLDVFRDAKFIAITIGLCVPDMCSVKIYFYLLNKTLILDSLNFLWRMMQRSSLSNKWVLMRGGRLCYKKTLWIIVGIDFIRKYPWMDTAIFLSQLDFILIFRKKATLIRFVI